MDAELRNYFDHWFGLIQQALGQKAGSDSTMDGRISTMEVRISGLEGEQKTLRGEMNEQFLSVDEQIRTLTLGLRQFEKRSGDDLEAVKQQVANLNHRKI